MSAYREQIPADTETAADMSSQVQTVLSLKRLRELEKAIPRLDGYLRHVMKKIKKQAAKGYYWIEYGGPWWYRMNQYDAMFLMEALEDKGFKADFTSNINRYVKILISWPVK